MIHNYMLLRFSSITTSLEGLGGVSGSLITRSQWMFGYQDLLLWFCRLSFMKRNFSDVPWGSSKSVVLTHLHLFVKKTVAYVSIEV